MNFKKHKDCLEDYMSLVMLRDILERNYTLIDTNS
jgi:hypothetical protein